MCPPTPIPTPTPTLLLDYPSSLVQVLRSTHPIRPELSLVHEHGGVEAKTFSVQVSNT